MTTPGTTSVRIDSEVARHLKLVAAAEGTSVKALIEQALLDHYSRHPAVRAAKMLSRAV